VNTARQSGLSRLALAFTQRTTALTLGISPAHSRQTSGRHARLCSSFRQLAKGNTPTGVISLKIGRTETAIRGKPQREGISLAPANRSPYNRRAKTTARRKAKRR